MSRFFCTINERTRERFENAFRRMRLVDVAKFSQSTLSIIWNCHRKLYCLEDHLNYCRYEPYICCRSYAFHLFRMSLTELVILQLCSQTQNHGPFENNSRFKYLILLQDIIRIFWERQIFGTSYTNCSNAKNRIWVN